MASSLPKVLHPVAGWPMISRAVTSVQEAGASEVRIVVGFGKDLVKQVVEPMGALCFEQLEQRGTGHAVMSAEPDSLTGTVIIMNGDHPLITPEDIEHVRNEFQNRELDLAVVTTKVKNPEQLGRIVRQSGRLKAIVEYKDASHDTRKINEVNTGMYVINSALLKSLLPKIQSSNKQNEFYLTDIVTLGISEGAKVDAVLGSPRVGFGVNSQSELARANRICFARKNKKLLDSGVIMIEPRSTYIEDEVEVGHGTVIYPNVYLKGKTKIGNFCMIEPNCHLNRATIGDSVELKCGTYIEDATVGEKSVVGPYAHLRPQTKLGRETKVGNFVELKKVQLGDGSKASHLTYLGDAIVGKNVNIGCGTITCNYAPDKKKYVTKIEDDVFVGSDVQFVAPITIGEGAVIGSGSTITKDVPAGALAVARGKQFIKENYKLKK